MKRPRNWWAGIAAGLTLGVAGVVAIDQAGDTASAQSRVTVSAEQLKINQRISQAAVRRSNESLDLLDPIRKSGAADDAPGWGTTQIRDGAVTSAKLDTAVREAQPRWAVVAPTTGALVRGKGATTSAKLATTGFYTVTFDRDVRACAIQATIAAADSTVTPVGQVSAWSTPNTPNTVTVRTAADDPMSGIPADVNNLPFHVTVVC
ncbi:MAG: hypothetical protein AB7V62_08805 [Thermoleophilia bacterium]